MGLRDHLDEALTQKGVRQLVIQIVIYNLPGRDCSALASNGELGPTEIDRYKTEYIDPIAAIMADPKYANLRIVTIIEIDSLPNLVTNAGGRPTAHRECDVMKANGNYVEGRRLRPGQARRASATSTTTSTPATTAGSAGTTTSARPPTCSRRPRRAEGSDRRRRARLHHQHRQLLGADGARTSPSTTRSTASRSASRSGSTGTATSTS